jgi:hypothetical protein
LLRVAQEFGLEGLAAKRPNSVYESGRRSGAWVKVKLTRAQEFVIGGYTLPEGSRKYFGSLLVGYDELDIRNIIPSSGLCSVAPQYGVDPTVVSLAAKSITREPIESSCRDQTDLEAAADAGGEGALYRFLS